jgi:DNA-directed RNA polymerase subunit L
MNPQIEKIVETDDTTTFTLSGVNVSIANSVRRTILSDILTVVFKTTPYEENKCKIMENTTRFNNEILKQRLSCVPIHISDLEMPLQNYLMELKMENTTDTMMFCTSGDFKIKNLTTDQYLSETDTRKIFPPDSYTGYFIDFARLHPKISDELPGEKIHLTCEFSIDCAKTDAMYNVVSTCAYGMTVDAVSQEEILTKKQQEWKDKDFTKAQIEFESKNWKLLEGLRVVKKDSFDFTLETIGVYENKELVKKACEIIIQKLDDLESVLEKDELEIFPSENTMKNRFDVILKNEDYTIGKALEYALYSKYYEDLKTMSFCGFKKMHPHDSDSIIRVAYKEPTEKIMVKHNLKASISELLACYKKMEAKF